MLRNPRVTIAPLPLYFYIPNFGGIVLSAKQLRIMQSLCTGIADAYVAYVESATDHQMQAWNKQFKWYFIRWAFRKIKYLSSDEDFAAARKCFVDLDKVGALSNPPYKWAEKTRDEIMDFIGK